MLNINISKNFFNLFYDPLEQFLIFKLHCLSNIFIVLTLIAILFCTYQYLFLNKLDFSKWNNYKMMNNILYEILRTTVYGNIKMKKQIYFPIFFCLFTFILLSNLIGLIPFSFTVTSSFMVALYYSLLIFSLVILVAIYHNGWKLSNLFLPEGVPLIIAFGVVLIEIISFFARVFSLSIRLFANMMSGHALMKILNGFSWSLATSSKIILILIAIIPWLIVTIVMFLESLIAFLQAYVFLTLSTIYINDVISSH